MALLLISTGILWDPILVGVEKMNVYEIASQSISPDTSFKDMFFKNTKNKWILTTFYVEVQFKHAGKRRHYNIGVGVGAGA